MKTKPCPECNGDGVLDRGAVDEQRCPTCGGSGVVADDDDDEGDVLNTCPEVQKGARLFLICGY
jgi:DnaJ-class molecular chaperone